MGWVNRREKGAQVEVEVECRAEFAIPVRNVSSPLKSKHYKATNPPS